MSDPCPSCAALVASWPEGQTGVRCPECDAVLTRAATHTRRVRSLDVPRALENLARWLPSITGTAASIEPSTRGSGHDGRPDHIDEHHAGLRLACETLRVVHALERTDKRHADVLWYAYVMTGDQVGRRVKQGSAPTGREERVGWAFASTTEREHWSRHKSAVVRVEMPRQLGETLIRAAVEAFVVAAARVEP